MENRREKQISVVGQLGPNINRYYKKVGRTYLLAGIVFLALLLVYIAGVYIFFGDYITYGNLKYLVRDFSAIGSGEDSSITAIVYNGSEGTKFSGYRGGVSVINNVRYTYYNDSGDIVTTQEVGFADPVMKPSGKYMMIYDLGGRGYSLYNQFTEVISREADGDIVSADTSDEGTFLVVHRGKTTRYTADLYSPAFKLVMSVNKDSYVTDCAVSSDGKVFALASAVPTGSDLDCEVQILRRGSQDPLSTLTYKGSMPIKLFRTTYGFILVTTDRVVFIDTSGAETGQYRTGAEEIRYADAGNVFTVIVTSSDMMENSNRIVVFDTSTGSVVHDTVSKIRIRGVYASMNPDECLAYIRTHEKIIRLKQTSADEIDAGGNVLDIIPMNRGILICREKSAERAFFETNN
ncbi:MAG: hypothetical protein IJU57_05640 [Clostridia bacterium]|nr:hypothetical protein [Clostridia bacterium]